jgi:Uma2 family endonuclease
MDTLLNPTLIAEILSESTEGYDRGRKFELYQSIESFRQYLLISSNRVRVDLYTRQSGGRWLLTSAGSLGDTIALDSIACQLSLAELYEKIDLAGPTLR